MDTRKKDASAAPPSTDASNAAVVDGPKARRPRKRRRRAMVTIVIATILLALVVAASSRRGANDTPTSMVRLARGGGAVGSQMTSFRLRDVSGGSVSIPVGGTPGVVMFSASSCTSCIPSMRALSALKTRFGPRLDATMVSIERGDTVKYLREWAALIGRVPFPLTIDTTQQLAPAFKVEYMGVMVIYNAHGRIVDRLDDPDLQALESGARRAGVS